MLVILLLACLQELSGSCESKSHCEADEICAKGACVGQSCEGDEDCRSGWECAEILGSSTCLIACEDDSNCLGEMGCWSVPLDSTPQSETFDYCL